MNIMHLVGFLDLTGCSLVKEGRNHSSHRRMLSVLIVFRPFSKRYLSPCSEFVPNSHGEDRSDPQRDNLLYRPTPRHAMRIP